MMMLLSLATTCLLALSTVASPAVPLEARVAKAPVKGCTPWMYGTLATNTSGTYYPFVLNKEQELAWNNQLRDFSLKVYYHKCLPNAGGNPNTTPGEHEGILYVPAINKCLAVTNQKSTKPPYYVKALTCKNSTDPAQAWLFRWPEDKRYPAIQWVGKTDVEGTNPQGGCGVFGYKSHDKGVPYVAADKAISLGCAQTTTPLR
ncbi:hypothetical protein BKA62DRAFT_738822, partial [Auriculariales sp. MPI-PUGE-AT-0066]